MHLHMKYLFKGCRISSENVGLEVLKTDYSIGISRQHVYIHHQSHQTLEAAAAPLLHYTAAQLQLTKMMELRGRNNPKNFFQYAEKIYYTI